MEHYFQIDVNLDIPIYRQLVDKIRVAVKMGDLVPGQQLPTVQELADQLSVAKGTIKRAYDELGNMGVLEKIQGRGTFVCYQPETSGSRKERAMCAIDSLLDELENMGFSSAEINIFLTLKQRERSETLSAVKVAVVECNPEALSQMCNQLRSIKGMELYTHLLDTIRQYPYQLDDETDFVITTSEHAEYIESILPDQNKLIRVASRLSSSAMTAMARLRTGDRIGIMTYSERFGDILYRDCRKYARNVTFTKPELFSSEQDIDGFLSGKDAVVVPVHYEKYCTSKVADKLAGLEKKAS